MNVLYLFSCEILTAAEIKSRLPPQGGPSPMPAQPSLPVPSLLPAGPSPSQPLFGPRALIPGEDAAAYDELLARVTARVQPADILEELWVRDVVDLFWDALRLRRLKAKVMAAAAPEELAKVLGPLIIPEPGVVLDTHRLAAGLAGRWALHDRDAAAKVDILLAAGSRSMDDVMARCLSLTLDEVERIDRMTMHAEIRRNAALREIERHRAAFAEAARRAIEDIADAEFEDVPGPTPPVAPPPDGRPAQGDRWSAA
jgi:hypothetical protein